MNSDHRITIAHGGVGFMAPDATADAPDLQGSGLVDALVKRSGGTITRQNEGGAHVTVRIPRPPD